MRTARRDWFQVLRDLKRAGVSLHAVARRCGRDHSTVVGWGEGSEPKESDARIVLSLYAQHCPTQFVEHQKQFAVGPELEALQAAMRAAQLEAMKWRGRPDVKLRPPPPNADQLGLFGEEAGDGGR